MLKSLSKIKKSYIAGFLDGDGSIYAQAKPNRTYRYGFQIALYVVFFQSKKCQKSFEEICSLVGCGKLRIRSDGILECVIGKIEDIQEFLKAIKPYSVLKKKQINLMLEIIRRKKTIKNANDFKNLLKIINRYRELNYSKRRKERALTP